MTLSLKLDSEQKPTEQVIRTFHGITQIGLIRSLGLYNILLYNTNWINQVITTFKTVQQSAVSHKLDKSGHHYL